MTPFTTTGEDQMLAFGHSSSFRVQNAAPVARWSACRVAAASPTYTASASTAADPVMPSGICKVGSSTAAPVAYVQTSVPVARSIA